MELASDGDFVFELALISEELDTSKEVGIVPELIELVDGTRSEPDSLEEDWLLDNGSFTGEDPLVEVKSVVGEEYGMEGHRVAENSPVSVVVIATIFVVS